MPSKLRSEVRPNVAYLARLVALEGTGVSCQ